MQSIMYYVYINIRIIFKALSALPLAPCQLFCALCVLCVRIAAKLHLNDTKCSPRIIRLSSTFFLHFLLALPPNQPYRLHYTHKRNCVLFQWKRIFITHINHVIAIIWLRFIADTAARNCVYNILLMRLQSKLSIDYNVFGRNSALFFLSRFFLSLVCFWNWKWCHRIRTDVHRHDTRTARQSIRPGHFGNKTMHIYESTVKQAK